MITVESVWKRELIRLASKLQKRYQQKRWTVLSMAALEKEVFIGAFAVRKLLDSNKISKKLSEQKISAMFYPVRNSDKIKEPIKHFTHAFDLLHGTRQELTIRKLMEQFIHSYHFSPFVPFGQNMVGIYVVSDWKRKEGLYYIMLKRLTEVFRAVGSEV
ncbi:MAG TPA: hypothetical protein VIK53_13815 [Verrucomicrobiae bacterium]